MAVSDNIVQLFWDNYKDFRDKRIVIYGLGGNTLKILNSSHIEDFNIVALMDSAMEGQIYYGLKVISVEEAKRYADIIIVVARDSVLRIIYNRIAELEKFNISIYDIKRNRLKEMYGENNNTCKNLSYWKKNLVDLKEQIDKYDIISFDIYDTLIMRRVVRNVTIFGLVEEQIEDTYGLKINFRYWRVIAEDEENKKNNGVPNIFQIYNTLQELTGVSDVQKENILSLEIEIEKKYSCVRYDMKECLDYALEKGKKVYLISDMYLSYTQIQDILNIHKITQYHKLLISCEYNKSKETGELYYVIDESERKKMLHIGDNYESDYKNAIEAGCAAYDIWSSYKMLINSNMNDILVYIKNIGDELLVGDYLCVFFNSPFAIQDKNVNKIILNTETKIMKLFFPYFLKITQWIVKHLVQKDGKKRLLLLSARDGWILKEILDVLIKDEEENKKNFNYEYFYTSRRAARVAGIYTEKDIEFCIENANITAEFGVILKTIFGILPSNSDEHTHEKLKTITDKNKISDYIKPYYNQILKNAYEERENYLKYIRNSFAIEQYDEVYIYDLACQGSIVYNVEKLLENKVRLICFATFNVPNPYLKTNDYVVSLLGNFDDYNLKYKFLLYYKLFEIISASKDTSVMCFNKDGIPIFDSNVKYINKYDIERMQNYIIKAIDVWKIIDTKWQLRDYSIEICDVILSFIESNYTIIDQKLKNIFIYDSKEDNDKEHNIWKEIVR